MVKLVDSKVKFLLKFPGQKFSAEQFFRSKSTIGYNPSLLVTFVLYSLSFALWSPLSFTLCPLPFNFSVQGDLLHVWGDIRCSGLAQGGSMGPLSCKDPAGQSNQTYRGEEGLYHVDHKQRELGKNKTVISVKYRQ